MRIDANAKRILGTLRYYIQISWPALPMAGATFAGLALGFLLMVRVFHPHSELVANLEVAGVMVALQAVVFVLAAGASAIAATRRRADPHRELPDESEER